MWPPVLRDRRAWCEGNPFHGEQTQLLLSADREPQQLLLGGAMVGETPDSPVKTQEGSAEVPLGFPSGPQTGMLHKEHTAFLAFGWLSFTNMQGNTKGR